MTVIAILAVIIVIIAWVCSMAFVLELCQHCKQHHINVIKEMWRVRALFAFHWKARNYEQHRNRVIQECQSEQDYEPGDTWGAIKDNHFSLVVWLFVVWAIYRIPVLIEIVQSLSSKP